MDTCHRLFFSPALLSEAEKFTLFIKNSITFPRFKVSRYGEGWGEDFCLAMAWRGNRGQSWVHNMGLSSLTSKPSCCPLRHQLSVLRFVTPPVP